MNKVDFAWNWNWLCYLTLPYAETELKSCMKSWALKFRKKDLKKNEIMQTPALPKTIGQPKWESEWPKSCRAVNILARGAGVNCIIILWAAFVPIDLPCSFWRTALNVQSKSWAHYEFIVMNENQCELWSLFYFSRSVHRCAVCNPGHDLWI